MNRLTPEEQGEVVSRLERLRAQVDMALELARGGHLVAPRGRCCDCNPGVFRIGDFVVTDTKRKD